MKNWRELSILYEVFRKQFDRDGYDVIENVFTAEEVDEMKAQINKVIDGFDVNDHPRSVFTSSEKRTTYGRSVDEYFLNSSAKIRLFYEEGAVDENGELTVDKHLAVNKIGHALHFLDPVFRKYTFHEKIKDIFRELNYIDPCVVQSMYIFKQPKIGGPVESHIDAKYLCADPVHNLVGIWIAIDDATVENGCLSFIPGKLSGVDYRFVRTHAKDGQLLTYVGTRPVYDKDKFIPVPIKKSSLILIHGLVPHGSKANTSEHSRHAYTFHVLDRHNSVWIKDNWLQETENYTFPAIYEYDEKKSL